MWDDLAFRLAGFRRETSATDGANLFPAIAWPSSNNYDKHLKFTVVIWNNGFHQFRDVSGYSNRTESFIGDCNEIACRIQPWGGHGFRAKIRWISQIKMCRLCGDIKEMDPPAMLDEFHDAFWNSQHDDTYRGLHYGFGSDESAHFTWRLAETFIELHKNGLPNMVSGHQCENLSFCRNDILERIRKHAVEKGMWEYASMREMKEHLRMLKEADRRSAAFAKARESTLRWLRSKPLRKKNLKFLSRLAMSEKLVQTTNHK